MDPKIAQKISVTQPDSHMQFGEHLRFAFSRSSVNYCYDDDKQLNLADKPKHKWFF